MKTIIQFQISQSDNHYVAEGMNVAIVTQGKTLDELTNNIREALALHFEGEDVESLGFSKSPSVLVNFELPQVTYA